MSLKSEDTFVAPHKNELQILSSSFRFNGKNYLLWSQAVRTYLKGKGKGDHLTTAPPEKDDPTFKRWDETDSMVMSWLWESMEPNISMTCMFLSTAKEIWDFLKRSYSKAKDEALIYEIQVKAAATKQGSFSVSEYSSLLQSLWQELDQYQVLKMKCSEDATLLKNYIQKQRSYQLLAGLNSEFDQIRVQILGHKDFPSLEEIISIVRAEESRRTVMLEQQTVEQSALLAKGEKKDDRWCTYCNKPRHTREKCWKLNGKPQSKDWNNNKGTSKPQANHVSQSVETRIPEGISVAELEKFKAFFNSLEKSGGSSSSTLALSGNLLVPLCLRASKFPLPSQWILDSGATEHMTNSSQLFYTFQPCSKPKQILTANGSLAQVLGQGTINISNNLSLKNVLLVPTLSANLISIHKLIKDLKCYALFSHSGCVLQDQGSGMKIGLAKEKDGLYYLDSPKKSMNKPFCHALNTINTNAVWSLHYRLGHPSFYLLKHLYPEKFQGINVPSLSCDVCEQSKHTRVSFPLSTTRSSKPFELIHSDIWGPSSIQNISGARWFVSFIDDCSRVTWVFLLKQKSDVSNIIPSFLSMIQTQFGVQVKRFRTDNAKDYFNNSIGTLFQNQGIIHESSCVYSPQQNGIAERKNRHLLEVTRALLFHHNVPKQFWGEALLTATFLINRLPSKVLNLLSPVDLIKQIYPDYRTINLPLRIFGCTTFVHVHHPHRGKLDPRAIKCIFIGYSPTQKGYKCYHPNTKKTYVSLDVTFAETTPFYPLNETSSQTFDCDSHPNNVLPTLDSLPFPQAHDSATSQPDSPKQPINREETSQSQTDKVAQSDPLSNISHHKPCFSKVYTRKQRPALIQQSDQSHPPDLGPESPQQEGTLFESQSIYSSNCPELELPIALRKASRSCTNNPLYPLANHVSFHRFCPPHKKFLQDLNNIPIPRNVLEALKKKEWKEAMREEMCALEKNNTWELVKRPSGKNIVDCKWIFTLKYKADGSLERYKARLVAKGFTQTYGIDYQETFAPVAKMNTFRILLSLAAHFSWPLWQFDVKNAFLHGNLDEEIYMRIPPGFYSTSSPNQVCKLRKALYGLKQSPRAWFGRFTSVMRSAGYKQSQGDHTLFIKHSASGGVTILLVYVDDIIVTGADKIEQENLKKKLEAEFEVKSLGRLKYFLGIEVAHSSQGIFISQQKYITDLLEETGKSGCKPASTPIDPNHKLGESKDDPIVDKGMYQRLCGKLIYLSHTRPDIAYPVSVVSQFMHNPRQSHLNAVYRILQYLKGCPGKGVYFRKGHKLRIEAFTDADYAGSIVDRRSTSGYCMFLGGNLVSWRSKKQNVVARSSAEAEFRALAHGLCEMLWLKIILTDCKIKWEEPMVLHCDNKSAISIAHNPVQHDRTKHVEIDRHFIKEKLEEGTVRISFVRSENQLADVLTKGIHCSRFMDLTSKLGLIDLYNPA